MKLRVADPGTPERYRGPRTCSVAGCTASTREGKPTCSDHVEHMPYAAGVAAEVAKRQRQQKRAT